MAALLWGAATDPGRVRHENEDAYVAEPNVFVVADGMGGHQAGEVASALAASTLRERLADGATSVDVVVAAVVEANAAIFQTAHNNAAQRGMGTTLTAVAVLPAADGRPDQLAIVNVGDSRVYLRRQGELTRATVDHSYVQELLATGHITEAEARAHPRRNIVTRALGIEPTVRVDSWLMPMVRGDRFVLCSDGLVDEVDDDEIHEIIASQTKPQDCADSLVAAAVGHGGRDNVTVIVVDVLDGLDPDTVALARLDDPFGPVMVTPGGADERKALSTAVDHLTREFRADLRRPIDIHISVLRHLLACLVLNLAHAARPTSSPAFQPSEAYLRFRDAVERDFRHSRCLDDYARALGYSSRTLSRATLADAGVNAKEFIDRRVVLEAKRLLAHSQWPAARIATELGFSSATNFSKYFHKHTGAAPIAFRSTTRSRT